MAYSNKEVIKNVNMLGKKADPQFICINPCLKRKNSANRYIEVQCVDSKEHKICSWNDLKNKVNPFRNGSSINFKIKKIIDNIGKKSNPPYICLNPESHRNDRSVRFVLVQCLTTKEVKEVSYADIPYRKSNPFRIPPNKFNNKKIKKIVNYIGQKSTPPFKFIPSQDIFINKKRFVNIVNLKTGEIRTVNLRNIMRGHNSFSEKHKNKELYEIHPIYENIFKKNNIVYFKNFRLKRKIIDFVFKIKNDLYGLEVKRSDLYFGYKNIKKQMNMYKKIGKLKKYNLKMILLTDPEGKLWRHGSLSIKELINFMRERK